MNDPLVCLPAEIVLRIIDYTRPREVASLTRLNKSWNGFIEKTHQEHIYSSDSKVDRPSNCRDFSFLDKDQSFAKYFDGVTSWKDVCKKQMLLAHNWTSRKPTTTESVMQIGTSPVWRFRPDFKRRFIVSTSQTGGVRVTDMDNGDLLWSLGDDDVRPYAHLEYQDGMAVWDRWGNAIEIWEADDTNRGTFQRTAILSHECETRGFQLSFDTLCVVSSDGEAFVYDMKTSPPTLRTHLDIEQEAVGHLYQSLDAIVCSIGSKGYHVHSKDSGALLGILQPNTCSNVYHIKHPRSPPEHNLHTMRQGPTQNVFPPQKPRKDRLLPLRLRSGKHPDRSNPLTLDQDEWGAGMIENNFIVGISRGGRLYICSDWQGALTSPEQAAASSAIIECESDGSTFDLGGWLSIKNHRVLLEVGDRIYIFTLNQEGPLPGTGEHAQPIWATSTSSAPQLKVPVSFMAIYDDCLMSTYTTLGWRNDPVAGREASTSRPRAFPTKAIRVVSLAPDTSKPTELVIPEKEEKDVEEDEEDSSDRDARTRIVTQSSLIQLVSLLATDSEEEDEEEIVVTEQGLENGIEEEIQAEVMEEPEEEWMGFSTQN